MTENAPPVFDLAKFGSAAFCASIKLIKSVFIRHNHQQILMNMVRLPISP